MKILSISDFIEPSLYDRFEAEQFANVDLILSCGDLSPEYLIRLAESLHAPLLYVCGNHDIRFGSKAPYGCTNINARIVKIQGYNILGLEGSRWYNGGRYQYTNRQMWKAILFLLPRIWRHGGIDIIITHAPPRYIHDKEDRCHKGFKSFPWLINRYSPRYFIHGHVHRNFASPDQRVTQINQTRVVNTCGHYVFEIKNSSNERNAQIRSSNSQELGFSKKFQGTTGKEFSV